MTGLSAAAIELLARGGRTFEVRLAGISMGRTIPDGSLVRVDPVDADAIRRGDVIAFRDDDRVVAHRVRFAARGHFVMLGDGYSLPDLPVPRSAILGRISAWHDGDDWRPVGRRRNRSLVAALVVLLVSCGLVVSPVLARKIAAFGVRRRSRCV
jgi:Peptidase S24-like